MPQRVICEQCGAILYEGVDLRPPDEIIQEYDGKCPKCGRKLSYTPKEVEVKSIEKSGKGRS
ncbi:MAG: hypothetical protein JSV29_00645 [Candidatus Bathyarchaeota archaeon]|nr:MAG: hypothetical protein JSV29_00645 [Candidatus Bathyarchaeota archaeon]